MVDYTKVYTYSPSIILASIGTSKTLLKEWSGNVHYPNANLPIYVASSSASDINKILTVEGIDSSFNAISEKITLSGQTAKLLDNSYYRINHLRVNAPLVGNVHASVDSDWTNGVPDDANSSLNFLLATELENNSLIYCVPSFRAPFHLVQLFRRVEENGGTVILEGRRFGASWKEIDKCVLAANSRLDTRFVIPFKFEKGMDLAMYGQSASSTTKIAGCMSLHETY
jgi:hypothetical protein